MATNAYRWVFFDVAYIKLGVQGNYRMNHHHLIFSTIISLSIISPTFGAEHDNAIIRYDGVYETPNIEDRNEDGSPAIPSCNYLRFYSDGTVITAGTECNVESTDARRLEKLKKWFHKGNNNLASAKFTIHERTISFSHVYSDGAFDFSGEVSGTTIRLSVFSHEDESQNTNNFVFIKW